MSGWRRALTAAAIVTLPITTLFAGASAASAAPGDPFDAEVPQVYIAQDLSPTGLYSAVRSGGGIVFTTEGSTGSFAYNAIGYNTEDNYIYGIRRQTSSQSSNNLINQLVRIGQGGVATSLGQVAGLPLLPANNPIDYNQGTFGTGADAQTLFVRRATVDNRIYAIDVTAATPTAVVIELDAQVPNVSDLVYMDGFLWSFHSNGRAYRIDPATGGVTSFATGIGQLANIFGAQWVYGNGNVGLSRNDTGRVLQVRIDDPASASPSFTVVSSLPGPASSNNDGTYNPGLPVDLSIVKTGPAQHFANDTLNYTLTVTNNGPGVSSGYSVTDALPAGLSSVATTTDGCTVTGNLLDCSFGELGVGETKEISVSGVASTSGESIVNTATVLGNERDSDPENNTGTHTSTPSTPAPGISLDKSYTLVDDANGNGINDAGDVIEWTFEVENTGNVPLTGVAVDDPLLDGLGIAVTCDPDALAAGESATCVSEEYTITDEDVDAGEIHNVATATGSVPPGLPGDPEDPTSPPSDATVPLDPTPAPGLSLVKGFEVVDDANGNGINDAGDVVKWTFEVENTGNVPLTGVAIDDPLLDGLGLAVSCDPDELGAGGSVVCESEEYTITDEDVEAGEIHNVATAIGSVQPGTPGDPDDPTSPPSEMTIPLDPTPAPGLELVKGFEVVNDANGNGINDAGDVVKWIFEVENTGNVTLNNITVHDELLDELGVAVTCGTAPLGAGLSTTCESAEYTITAADVAEGEIHNVATVGGEVPEGTPGDPDDPTSPPSETTIPLQPTPAPALSLVKRYVLVDDANDNGINDAGDVIRWEFDVENTGNVALTDVAVSDPLLDGLGVAVSCDPDSLGVGESTTCESAEYTITAADVAEGEIHNVATASGSVPPGLPGDPEDPTSPPAEATVPLDPTPTTGLSLVKRYVLVDDANDNGVNDPGDVIRWEFDVTNTGTVTLNDVAVNDPLLDELGIAVTCDAAPLAGGTSTTCASAEYTITAADAAAGGIRNVATVSGEVPEGTPGDPEDPTSPPSETTVPLTPLEAKLKLVKSALLNDANGNGKADVGETIQYSFLLTNTGSARLTAVHVRDALLENAGIAVSCPSTELAPAETMSCAASQPYTVTRADVAKGQVVNVATAHGTPPVGVDPLDPPRDTVVVETASKPTAGLELTGGQLATGAIALGVLLLLGGGALVLAKRRRATDE